MKRYSFFFSLAVFSLLSCCDALAQQGILADVVSQYQAATDGWMVKSLTYAKQLFFLLASIEIAVTSIYLLFQKDGAAEFFSSLFLKLLTLMFGYVLLVKAPEWIPTIIASFTQAGASVGGTPALDPSTVLNQGLRLSVGMASTADISLVFSPLIVLTIGLTTILVVFAYILIAGEMLVTLVESYIVIGGGVLMIGFWGLDFSRHLSIGFLNAVLRIGLRLFTLFLIIGVGLDLQNQFLEALAAAAQQTTPAVGLYLSILAGSFVFAFLAVRVPRLADGMLSGQPGLGFSSMGSMGANIARAVEVGVVQGMRSDRTASKPSEGSAAMREAAKYGQGERHSYGSGAAGTEARRRDLGLPDVQPYKGGLNTVTPQTPSGAGGTATRKSDFDFPNVQPHHGASLSPRLNLPDVQPHKGGLNTISPNPPPAPAPAPAGQRP